MRGAFALTCALSAVAAACGEIGVDTPAVPPGATPVEEARPGPAVLYGYLTAPWDDDDKLCSEVDGRGTCLVVQALEASAYPGLDYGCCSVGYFSTTKVPIRGVVRGRKLIADPSESLRGCVTAMEVNVRGADERAVARALLEHPDVQSVRAMTVRHGLGGSSRWLVASPASAAAARAAARAGEILAVGCKRA